MYMTLGKALVYSPRNPMRHSCHTEVCRVLDPGALGDRVSEL